MPRESKFEQVVKEKAPEPLAAFEELRKSRQRVDGLVERFGDWEGYAEKVDQYIDSRSNKEIFDLAEELKKELVAENSTAIKLYKEFGIDPLATDLTKCEYPFPITFAKRLIYGKDHIERVGVAGFYIDSSDEIIVYIPDKENERILKKYLMNTEPPDDLRSRIKHFLKFDHFGPLAYTILHERIHKEQRNLESPSVLELREAQAFDPLNESLKAFSLIERASVLFPKTIDERATDLEKMIKELSQMEQDFFIAQTASILGIPKEDFLSSLKDLPKRGCKKIEELIPLDYNFDKDKLIIGFHLLDQLRALKFTEKEVATAISRYGDKYDNENACYPHLENFIKEQTQQKGLSEDDLEQLTMVYKIQRMVDWNKAIANKLKFAEEKILSRVIK